jgi:hypothetical protein
MSEFAYIPPPLFEQVPGSDGGGNGSRDTLPPEVLSAKYQYYDDRPIPQDQLQEPLES